MERAEPSSLMRWDVLDHLRRVHGFQELVKIVTPSTSIEMEGRPELTGFTSETTLRYADDMHRAGLPRAGLPRAGLPHARDLLTLAELVALARRTRVRADIVFVDPWHTYTDSITTLLLAIEIVRPGGVVVCHDVLPHEPELVVTPPRSLPASWCGETWRAFVDLTARLPKDWEWSILDVDFGIGIISVPDSFGTTESHRALRTMIRHPRATLRRIREGRGIADGALRRVPPELDLEEGWHWLTAADSSGLHIVPGNEFESVCGSSD